ncbi:hypothetical protein MKQ70_17110 [Chitinophaga sedimenti]|nr:flavoprotein [Chitinophaga sedimenti]MCK7556643.1 hypothetical protein [Chitinophaga sedimenti]
MKHRIVVAVTGASGSIYARQLLQKLAKSGEEVAVVMTENAKTVWHTELDDNGYEQLPFRMYAQHDFHAPFASGSGRYDTMIICPCSMGTLGRIAGASPTI